MPTSIKLAIAFVVSGILMLALADFLLARIMRQIDSEQTEFPYGMRRSQELRVAALRRFNELFPNSHSVELYRASYYAGLTAFLAVPVVLLIFRKF